jgi:hypothetical protein
LDLAEARRQIVGSGIAADQHELVQGRGDGIQHMGGGVADQVNP